MNLTYNSTICTFLKYVKEEVKKAEGYNAFLCTRFIVRLTDLIMQYNRDTGYKQKINSSDLGMCIKYNINEFIPEFNRKYAETLGFKTDYTVVWFHNNKERIKFLDNLITIYKDKRTSIKSLIKQFIKNHNL